VRSAPIEAVLSAVRQRFGSDSLTYYGSGEAETHGVCFRVWSVPATVSVHTQEGALSDGLYDTQIDSVPPGEYIYTSVVSLPTLLGLIDQLRQPLGKWPMSAA